MQVRHGHLYIADLNPRQGTEAGKIRPVVVIQTDYLNEVGHPSTWVLPCTTKTVGENILRVVLPKKFAGNTEDCEVMLDQSRSIDNKRFQKEIGKIPLAILKEIKEKLRLLANL
ncbi:MAG: type II toxin-antitoxin system PemK/MazF family toxin [Bdellovibrio sp.]|nr:MAG: type II toxin-antitoxin system PemK/MazF family toxin [Bdellovibrio sp.]